MSVLVKQFQRSLKSLLRSLISNVCKKKKQQQKNNNKRKYENTAFPRTQKHNLEKKKINKLEKRLKKKNLEYTEYFFPL